MNHLWLTAYSDIIESLRARWFMVYSMVFGGIVVILFAFGLSESRIMGFTGLSRLLVTYIQLSMAILPIFVLITTVRSVAGDREAGIFKYTPYDCTQHSSKYRQKNHEETPEKPAPKPGGQGHG